jgi:uncharacterized protein
LGLAAESSRPRIEIIPSPGARDLSRPNILVGVPEVGLVSTIAASYLMDQLRLPEIGVIESELLPQVVVVHEGEPKRPIRIYGRDNLVVVISESPLIPRLTGLLSAEIVRWGKTIGSNMIIGATGIPSPNRVKADNDQDKPRVFCVTPDVKLRGQMSQYGTLPFQEGVLVGMFASLLKQCMLQTQTNVTFLVESFLDFPDPEAAAALLEVLNRFLSLNVDLKPLLEESEEIRLKSRELMSKTQQAMQQNPPEPPAMYK